MAYALSGNPVLVALFHGANSMRSGNSGWKICSSSSADLPSKNASMAASSALRHVLLGALILEGCRAFTARMQANTASWSLPPPLSTPLATRAQRAFAAGDQFLATLGGLALVYGMGYFLGRGLPGTDFFCFP